MTKLEAIEILNKISYDYFDYNHSSEVDEILGAIEIALECIQDKVNEEDHPCYNCYDKHCDNCLYSGRIPR